MSFAHSVSKPFFITAWSSPRRAFRFLGGREGVYYVPLRYSDACMCRPDHCINVLVIVVHMYHWVWQRKGVMLVLVNFFRWMFQV